MMVGAFAQQCYTTVDGSPSKHVPTKCTNAPRNDVNAPTSLQGYANTQVAGTRCCSTNSNAGPKNNGGTSICNSNCERRTWAQARAACQALGNNWDLCQPWELINQDKGKGTGCNYDAMHVWTKQPCPFTCDPTADFFQDPSDGLLVVEVESLQNSETNYRWEERTEWTNPEPPTGGSYMYYAGQPNTIIPRYRLIAGIELTTAGLHRFMCRGYVDDDDSTADNDFWIRFKGGNVVSLFSTRNLNQAGNAGIRKYACDNQQGPGGSDLTPYSNGCDVRNDGFMKVYNSMPQTRNWNWRSKNSDFDARDVYVEVSAPGKITMQIASRSNYAIDRCVMYPVTASMTDAELNAAQNYATNLNRPETRCG